MKTLTQFAKKYDKEMENLQMGLKIKELDHMEPIIEKQIEK